MSKPLSNGRSRTFTARSATLEDEEAGKAAFVVYCVFIVSYFLHLGTRIEVLGTLRVDVLLCGLALMLIMRQRKRRAIPTQPKQRLQPASRLLLVLAAYIVVSLPFVRWPGSVLDHGWEPFLKAVLFYVLTVATVTTEKRLRVFLAVFLSVQTFRVLEPLYLHVTTGYWGSFTNMGNYEFMDRLSGAPFDVVNPNGLAFIIIVVITLSHQVLWKADTRQKLLYIALLVPLLYAMVLSASRSAMLGLLFFAVLVVLKSKRRVTALCVLAAIVTGMLANMSDIERQRYLSIVDHSAKGGETSEGRINGMWQDLQVGLERPIFGHGLGTSLEANANATGEALPSHTLYTEVLQELGLVGLAIFLLLLIEICRNCMVAVKDTVNAGGFVHHTAESTRDFVLVLTFFSLASYGLNEYQWYLVAGLSVVLRRLSMQQPGKAETVLVAGGQAASETTHPPAERRKRMRYR